jgi:hypothetical protein
MDCPPKRKGGFETLQKQKRQLDFAARQIVFRVPQNYQAFGLYRSVDDSDGFVIADNLTIERCTIGNSKKLNAGGGRGTALFDQAHFRGNLVAF